MSRLSGAIHKYLTEDAVSKLTQKRILTTIGFLETDSEFIAKHSGLQFRHVLAIKDSILAKYGSKIRKGNDLYQEVLTEGAILPTGISKLDSVLQGGLYTGSLYELCGASACGKSQICMFAAANVSFSCQQSVLYIDTKQDLSAERLISFLQTKTEQVGECLQRILVCHCRTTYDLISCLHEHIEKAKERRIRLIVVDSVAALHYQHLGDFKGISLLSCAVNLLRYIANEYHTAVLMTNLTTTWQGSEAEKEQKAALGRYWSHVPTTRLTMSRLTGSAIVLTVTKSSSIAIGSTTTLSIQEDGVS